MTIVDPYFSANRAPQPDFRIIGASHMTFDNPYRMFANSLGTQDNTDQQSRRYPNYFGVASLLVIMGVIIGGFVGYFFPGPITGLFLPLFVTLWWYLYRAISRFDANEDG